MERIDESIQTLQPQPETDDEYRRAEGDLKAQEEMADWAEMMFYATAISVIVSAIGVGLILLTLRQNKKAMQIAINAADAANRAADVERGFVFVKPEFVHQARYSKIRDVTYDPPVLQPVGRYTIKNFGRTPLIVWSIKSDLNILSRPQEMDNTLPMPITEFPGGKILEPGDDWTSKSIQLPIITQDNWHSTIEAGTAFVWFGGEVSYEDVHGVSRATRFRWVYNGLTDSFGPYGKKPYNERT